MSSPTKKQRVGIVVSAAYLVLSLAFALQEGYYWYEGFGAFLLHGVLPVGIAWGIWWIRRGKKLAPNLSQLRHPFLSNPLTSLI